MKGRGLGQRWAVRRSQKVAFGIFVAVAAWFALGLVGALVRGNWGFAAVAGVALAVQLVTVFGYLSTHRPTTTTQPVQTTDTVGGSHIERITANLADQRAAVRPTSTTLLVDREL